MSSILKALRKLEEQQAARRGGTAPAVRNVPSSGPRWRAPAAILVVLILAVAGTVAVMNRLNHPTAPGTVKPSPRLPESAKPAPAARLPETVPIGEPVQNPAAVTGQSTAPETAVPLEESLPARAVAPPPVPAAPTARRRPASAVPSLQDFGAEAQFAAPARGSQVQHQAKAAKPVDRALAVPPAPQALTVSGIAWQKGESDRIAMVNGSPVSEGTVVAGAKVLEIKPDRVRFSRDGSTFDVSIGTGSAGR